MKWQPIETAPKDGTRILALIQWIWDDGALDEVQDVICWHKGGGFWVCCTPRNYIQALDEGVNPTRWQPLPEPPHD